jgi:hypothetical protein
MNEILEFIFYGMAVVGIAVILLVVYGFGLAAYNLLKAMSLHPQKPEVKSDWRKK